MHINIFIDESKHFESGHLIFGGFYSTHTKSYLDRWIIEQAEDIGHSLGREMKSSERDFGRTYLDDGFLCQHNNQIQGVFGVDTSGFYQKDNYPQYRDGLHEVLIELQKSKMINTYDEIYIYIDKIKLLSDPKTLERTLKKDLRSLDNRIHQVTMISSSTSGAIQLADLITGYFKNHFRGIETGDFTRVFSGIPHSLCTKKS